MCETIASTVHVTCKSALAWQARAVEAEEKNMRLRLRIEARERAQKSDSELYRQCTADLGAHHAKDLSARTRALRILWDQLAAAWEIIDAARVALASPFTKEQRDAERQRLRELVESLT